MVSSPIFCLNSELVHDKPGEACDEGDDLGADGCHLFLSCGLYERYPDADTRSYAGAHARVISAAEGDLRAFAK